MRPRSNQEMKLYRQTSRDMRAKRDQTFSAPKASASKFGFLRVGPGAGTGDPVRDAIRRSGVTSRRPKAKITLAPTPWDDEGPDR